MTEQVAVKSIRAEDGRRWLRAHALRRLIVALLAIAVVALAALAVGRIPIRSGPSVANLNAAVNASVAALAASPAVEGVQESYISDHLASATWFDWRPDGTAVVIQRLDVDVAESGWWADPAEGPPSVGTNVTTTIRVLVGATFYEAVQIQGQSSGTWTVLDSQEAPRGALALGLAVLSDGEWVLGVDEKEDGAVEHAISPDGGSTWTLTSPDLDGSVVQRWHIAADGKLTSWSFERLDSDGFESRIADPTTAGRMTFLPVTAPDPMRAPDPDVEPNVTQLGLPESFPMAAP